MDSWRVVDRAGADGVESVPGDKLTIDAVEKAALPGGQKIAKLSDGGGLYLLIEPRGKSWRFRYRRAGKDALMSLGTYPETSLASARTKADEVRALLAKGEDPQAVRQKQRDQKWVEGAKTFGVAAGEYNAKQDHRAKKTVDRCRRMYRHSTKLHHRTFAELDRPMLLQACRTIEAAGKHETAHRLGIYFAQVFRYARDEGYFKGVDPTAGGFGKSLKPLQEEHHAALTDPKAVGSLLANIDSWEWLDTGRGIGATVGRGLQLLARTAVRPGELAKAEWEEILGDTWTIPVHRMKMRDSNRTNHVVPLSRQAILILEAQRALTGHGRYVFPNARTDARPMSDAALSVALIAIGYRNQHVPHGFRTTFKTLAQDVLKVDRDLVERQLAHKIGSDVEGAYDKSQRLDERRILMQRYSDLLDRLRGG